MSESYSKDQAGIQPIIGNPQPVDKVSQNLTLRSRHAEVIHMLDTHGTLTARAHQGLRASLKGVACLVAIAIGIALSIQCFHALHGKPS